MQISKPGTVIHNFVNENIHELASVSNPFETNGQEKLKLAIVSRLSAGKGFERVVKMVQALERKNVPYSLKIVGKGRAKEQEIRQWLKPYSGVQFVGYQDNPYCYVKNADYLVLLSDYESWGNVITEAKELKVPCFVTDFPSAKEQIEDGKNGIIVSRNIEDYDTAVERLVREKTLLKSNLKDFHYENEISNWSKMLEKYKNKPEREDR